MSPSSLDELIESLRCLPGVGPKSAQRMAYHLLQRNQKGAARLAGALSHALAVLQHCSRCNTFSEEEICQRCANPHRDASLLCVVEMPADLAMIEQTQAYGGLYYVLMGRLSPLDGIGHASSSSTSSWRVPPTEWCPKWCWRPISPTRARQPLTWYPNCCTPGDQGQPPEPRGARGRRARTYRFGNDRAGPDREAGRLNACSPTDTEAGMTTAKAGSPGQSPERPLAGVRVIEFGTLIAGPSAPASWRSSGPR